MSFQPKSIGLVLILLAALAGMGAFVRPAEADAVQSTVKAPLAARSLLLDGTRAGDRIVVVGERGHILYSDDHGVTWTQADVPTRATLTAVTFIDAETGWAVGHDATILHSRDGGKSWAVQHQAPDWPEPLLDVLMTDARNGIATGAYGLYLETADGGLTWSRRPISDTDFHNNAVATLGPDVLLIAGEAGTLLRSSDGGADWEPIESPYEGSFFGVLTLSAQEALIYGMRGHLFRTEDGGAAWHAVETGTTASLMNAVRLPDGRIVLSGLSGTLLVSADGGRSVTRIPRTDRAAITAAIPTADGKLVLVGEQGVLRIDASASGAGG